MAIIWPPTLPAYPNTPVTDELQESRVRSEMDAGPPLVRRRFTAALRIVEFPMILTGAERVIFDDFYKNTLGYGASRFQWVDPVDDSTVQYRFAEPPKWTTLHGGDPAERKWESTFRLEIIPGEFEEIIPTVQDAAASFVGTASLSATPNAVFQDAVANLNASATIAATATAIRNAEAALNASAAISVTVAAIRAAIAALSGSASLSASAGNTIPAMIFDGFQSFTKHTGGLTGDANSQVRELFVSFEKSADGARQVIRANRNGTGTVFEWAIEADNTVSVKAWSETNPKEDVSPSLIFSCATTETWTIADGQVECWVSILGTHCDIQMRKAGGVFGGTNTPGAVADIDWTSDHYFGANDGADYLGADFYGAWEHNVYHGGSSDAEWREQFYDTTNNRLRNRGAEGRNPLGGIIQPLLDHIGEAANQFTNRGSGGPADAGNNAGDGTSPGAYSDPLTNAFDLFVDANVEAGWSGDHSANTTATGFDKLADRTGNGNDATQATGTQQPTRLVSSGLTSWEFDGGDDVLVVSGASAGLMNHANAGGTDVLVSRPDSASTFMRGWQKVLSGADSGEYRALETAASTLRWNVAYDYSTTGSRVRQATAYPTAGQIHINDARVDKTGDASDLVFGIDNTEVTPSSGTTFFSNGVGTPGDLSGGDFYLGNRFDNLRCFEGGQYEMWFWSRVLTDLEMGRVRTHLARKYGVTLA
ncbi:MAG: hypothetical protein AAF942_00050 [Pseudomonadota bacterium]